MNRATHKGFVWPASDNHCHKVIWAETGDIDYALQFTDRRKIAVQAGGNVGVWASVLAGMFEMVFTYEPDQENYDCLVQNVPDNVHHSRVALSNHNGLVGMYTEPANVGAHHIFTDWSLPEGRRAIPSVSIPCVTLDSLNLPGCDYLCLDIEGAEPMALWGAEQTIRRFRPLIHIEEKGLSEKYFGISRDASTTWLANLGYQLVGKIRKDLIFRADA